MFWQNEAVLSNIFIIGAAIRFAVPLCLGEISHSCGETGNSKRMADDAVAGKAEMGRVVSGGFSFNDIVKEYRSKEAQGTPDIPLTTGGDITQMRPEPLKQESSAQEEGEPLVEKIPVDSDVKVERIEAERLRAEVEEKSDFIKREPLRKNRNFGAGRTSRKFSKN